MLGCLAIFMPLIWLWFIEIAIEIAIEMAIEMAIEIARMN